MCQCFWGLLIGRKFGRISKTMEILQKSQLRYANVEIRDAKSNKVYRKLWSNNGAAA